MIFYILDDKCRGWWRLSDIEDVNQLEATLNSRGTREQHLLTLVKRNFELLQDAAKKWVFFYQFCTLLFLVCAQRSKIRQIVMANRKTDAFKKKHPRARKICQIVMPSCKTKRFHKLFGLPLLPPF